VLVLRAASGRWGRGDFDGRWSGSGEDSGGKRGAERENGGPGRTQAEPLGSVRNPDAGHAPHAVAANHRPPISPRTH
jgi:hypothetical protein